MKNSILFTFLFLLSLGINAQTTVSGTISDGSEGLIGASVQVDGTDKGAVTNLDGMYSISLEDGTYTITASYTGFESMSKTVNV